MAVVKALAAPDVISIDCLALSRDQDRRQFETITVNQGTARKTKAISHAEHAYPIHRPPARQVFNQFTVQPRGAESITVPVMERHPFTTQSFIPLSSSRERPAYLVVVAEDNHGKPDLQTLKAWVCHGGQMVTYAQNQWHAPMIALYDTLIFVVTNAENGTTDDLQEHFFASADTPSVHIDNWHSLIKDRSIARL